MKCLIFFGMSSMKEGTSAQLSGRGELHGGARVTTLVTLRKCTLGHKREIKTLRFVLASTKGFEGGLAWIKPSKKDMAVTLSYSVPPPAARPLGRAAGAPRPVCPGCGRCGCGSPAPAPRRAPLQAGVARRGGGGRASPGGVPSAVVRGVWGQALPLPRLPALPAGCPGPPPTGCGCEGVRAWGPITNPTARALAGLLCALWGRHEDARGGRLLPGCGSSGVGRSPIPDCPPSGRAAGAHYPLAVGAGGCRRGDPSPTPQRALWRAGFARCGGGTRAPGGGASCLGVGRPGSGALPTPTA